MSDFRFFAQMPQLRTMKLDDGVIEPGQKVPASAGDVRAHRARSA